MPATITDDFKRTLIDDLYNDFINLNLDSADPDASRYYVGIGHPQPWPAPDSDTIPPAPNPSQLEVMDFRDNVQTYTRCNDATYVVRRYNWNNGGIYSGWNNKYHSNNLFLAGGEFEHPYYVMTGNNQVYVCIKQGKDDNGLPANSSVQPTIESGDVFETSDGYQWKYLYTVGAIDTQLFLTSGFIPSATVLDSADGGPSATDLDTFKQEQLLLQKQAVPGTIVGVEVEEGGRNFPDGTYEIGFDGVPLKINGADQPITNARGWAKALGGRIVEVTMRDPGGSGYYFGENYYNAVVRWPSGSPGNDEVLRPIISKEDGLGAGATLDLNSTAIMFNVILDGEEDGSAIVDNDFRQVGLVRNPLVIDSDGLGGYSSSTLNTDIALLTDVMQYNISDAGVSLDLDNLKDDNIITGQTSGAVAILNNVEGELFQYTQNRDTGYGTFQVGEPIDISSGGGSTSIVALFPSAIERNSGEVYYIDNRRPFMRSSEQIEDIKIVIDF